MIKFIKLLHPYAVSPENIYDLYGITKTLATTWRPTEY